MKIKVLTSFLHSIKDSKKRVMELKKFHHIKGINLTNDKISFNFCSFIVCINKDGS